MRLRLVSSKDIDRPEGADAFGFLSLSPRPAGMGSYFSLRYFGRNTDSMGAFLSYHSPGPDGRCLGCMDKLAGAHKFLSDWFWKHVVPNYSNAHVAWAYRGQADQDAFYHNGTSRLQWPHSAHNKRAPIDMGRVYDPSDETDPNTKPEAMAIDLFQIVDGVAIWPTKFFYDLANDIRKLDLPIYWGGQWKSLGDKDHFQYMPDEMHLDS